MNQIVTKGIVLARTDFGEADRILTVITPDHGKIRVMAKGVRKVKSKLAGGIELFSVSTITYIPGRKDIGTLVSTRLIHHYGHIVADIARTMLAYEVLKRINSVTEDAAEHEYFTLLDVTLASLDRGTDLQLVESWFDLHCLMIDGHTPNFLTDGQGKPLDQSQMFLFDFEKMCFVAHQSGQYLASDIKLLRLLVQQTKPDALQKVTSLEATLPRCKQLITQLRTISR